MLVYAIHLGFHGAGAKEAIFRAVGGWLKEQLGFGLHPDQLRRDGSFSGHRGDVSSWLQIQATTEAEPELYSWILKNPDADVRGRQWITELGLKLYADTANVSCVVKTEEHSTLVAAPVAASRPRVIGYVISNVQQSVNADFSTSVPGVTPKSAGEDLDSYRALLAEIDRPERESPIVLVSPTSDGEYLLSITELQDRLVGLAQVVYLARDFNSYDMAEIVGQARSVWNGATNLLLPPGKSGFVRNRLFLSEEILRWGDSEQERISRMLAWVTSVTNIAHLRRRIAPEGVVQLALRRRLQSVRDRSGVLNASQLKEEIDKATRLATEQAEWIKTLEEENTRLESELSENKELIAEERDEARKQNFLVQVLKNSLESAGQGITSHLEGEALLDIACSSDPPSPLECLDVIETVHGDKCIVLETAKESAKEMRHFTHGRRLLDMLRRLATDYRSRLIQGGDSEARMVFAKSEYAAKESETVMANKGLRRLRTFPYESEQIEMERHLKIGSEDNVAKTIRVYFHWDAKRGKIVIGYCGEHLPVSSH